MAFCEQCGNKLGENAKFCGKCGTPVPAEQAETQQASASGNSEDPASKAFNAGVASLQEERYAEAVKHFTEAIKHNPNEAEYYNGRGLSHSNLGSSDAAIADYSKAIQLRPDSAEIYAFRGMEYIAKDDLANARADLERGLQIDPNEESVARLAEAIKEIDGEGGMSAPTACAQCGAQLDEGDVFCANCGAEVGAAVQQQPAPVQAQRQVAGGQVLKEHLCRLVIVDGDSAHTGDDNSKLFLYSDRLEWTGRAITIVVPIAEISSVKRIFNNIKVISTKNYEFWIDMQIAPVTKAEADSWVSAINSARNEK